MTASLPRPRQARARPARCAAAWAAVALLAATAGGALASPDAAAPESPQIAQWRAQALAHEHGEGVARDGAEALRLYCLAARHGDAVSLYHLGWMLANGRGVPRDDAQAAWFFDAAARLGDEPARRMLAVVGPAGDGVPACMRPPEPAPAEPPVVQAAAPQPAPAPVLRRVPPQAPKAIVDLVHKLAPRFQIEPHLVLAIIAAESNFDPAAVSPKNAQGLMQLIPDTAARFNVRDPFDPAQSIRGGMAYLRWLLAYFEGDVALVAAAYNAGEGAVDHYKGVPPFAETRAYLGRIRRFIGDMVLPFDASVVGPSPSLRQIRLAAVRR